MIIFNELGFRRNKLCIQSRKENCYKLDISRCKQTHCQEYTITITSFVLPSAITASRFSVSWHSKRAASYTGPASTRSTRSRRAHRTDDASSTTSRVQLIIPMWIGTRTLFFLLFPRLYSEHAVSQTASWLAYATRANARSLSVDWERQSSQPIYNELSLSFGSFKAGT